jgi:hypothetical protein
LDGVVADRALGSLFLLVVCLGAALYLGVGVLYRVHTRGEPVRLASHPHAQQFRQLYALCADGVAFVRQGGGGGGRSSRRGRGRPRDDDADLSTALVLAGRRDCEEATMLERARKQESKKKKKKKSGKTAGRQGDAGDDGKGRKKKGMKGMGQGGGASMPAALETGGLVAEAAVAETGGGTAASGGGRWLRVLDDG